MIGTLLPENIKEIPPQLLQPPGFLFLKGREVALRSVIDDSCRLRPIPRRAGASVQREDRIAVSRVVGNGKCRVYPKTVAIGFERGRALDHPYFGPDFRN